MPIYEYVCNNCDNHFEKLQKISDEPKLTCENCQEKASRIVSKAGFRLKGGGWYETDFKSDKENKRNLAVSEDKQKKSDGKSEKNTKQSESKPADKTKDKTKTESK